MNEEIAWLRDDIQCLRNILRSENDPAIRLECEMRIKANIEQLDLINTADYCDSSKHVY